MIEKLFPTLSSRRVTRNSVFLIGIGGNGMSSLARWFLSRGWRVFGSDRIESLAIRSLRREGAHIDVPRSKRIVDAELVVHSQAVPKTDPDMMLAVKKGLPIFSYPKIIGKITELYTTVAVAGAHGKTTTTALIGTALMLGKKDPTVIVGASVPGFKGGNFRNGSRNLLVLEADEYGRAFLNYSPAVAVVTNIDREHLDTYGSISNIKSAFLNFLSRTRVGGALVLNSDNLWLESIKRKIEIIAKERKLQIFWYSIRDKKSYRIRSLLRISGEHNVSNALAAYYVAKYIFNIPETLVFKAIAKYTGASRRMEYKGTAKLKVKNQELKVKVYDDYAHHPSEIKATLAAFKEKYPNSPLICVFQPHQALRLRRLFKDFVSAFKDADSLVLFPTYEVAGRDKSDVRFTSESLARKIHREYPLKPVLYLGSPETLRRALSNFLSVPLKRQGNDPVLVMMGAGNVVEYSRMLLK